MSCDQYPINNPTMQWDLCWTKNDVFGMKIVNPVFQMFTCYRRYGGKLFFESIQIADSFVKVLVMKEAVRWR
jgi:hypothetical protein